MITAADVRAVAMSLPRTEEHLIRDYIKFRVGKIVYASISPDEALLGFGFPKEERAAMIESQPDRFLMPRLSDQRFHWINARMAAFDEDEMRELITDAWRMVVPKKVAAARLGLRSG
ncbi:MAG TPA: MmcQ/YjbR family DNA-binding protein [Trebonia sp.]